MSKPVDPQKAGHAPGAAPAEEALIETRKAKAKAVRARNENPFANDVGARFGKARGASSASSVSSAFEALDIGAARARAEGGKVDGKYVEEHVKAAAGATPVSVRGRVIALRSTGGLSFLKIRDRTGEIQLLASESVMGAEYARLAREQLDLARAVADLEERQAARRAERDDAPTDA
ncbi:hypothetical protein EON77_06100, partial [bacterium]